MDKNLRKIIKSIKLVDGFDLSTSDNISNNDLLLL